MRCFMLPRGTPGNCGQAQRCEWFREHRLYGQVFIRHAHSEPSRQPRVFCLCSSEERNIRVGVLLQREKIVVSAFRLQGVAGERERSHELQPRHGVHRIDENDAAMAENPLEFAGAKCSVSQPTYRLRCLCLANIACG